MKKTATRLTIAALSVSLFAAPAQAAFVSTPAPAVEATTTTTTNSETVLKNAVAESWTSLSRSERKSRINAAKDALKNMKDASSNTVLLVILAILLPPVAVLVHQGTLNSKFWISLLLWLLFYIPGLIYALLVIFGKA